MARMHLGHDVKRNLFATSSCLKGNARHRGPGIFEREFQITHGMPLESGMATVNFIIQHGSFHTMALLACVLTEAAHLQLLQGTS